MTKLADKTDIPTLPGGWVPLSEAGERLGYTRAYMYKKAAADGFSTLHKLGTKASYVINESEIEKLLGARVEAPAVVEEVKPPKKTKAEKPLTDSAPVDLSIEEILAKI